MDIEALRGDTHLPGIANLGRDPFGRDLGQIVGIGKDDHRSIATHFQSQPGNGARGPVHQQLSDPGRAGEADLAAAGIVEEDLTDRMWLAVDQIRHPGRQTRLPRGTT